METPWEFKLIWMVKEHINYYLNGSQKTQHILKQIQSEMKTTKATI